MNDIKILIIVCESNIVIVIFMLYCIVVLYHLCCIAWLYCIIITLSYDYFPYFVVCLNVKRTQHRYNFFT